MKNAQTGRWLSELSEFELKMKHRSGVQMAHVDALSRASVDSESLVNFEVLSVQSPEDEILVFQRSNPKILEIVNILRMKEPESDKVERTS